MDSLRLDPNTYLSQHLSEAALGEAPTRGGSVGHVHLSVGDTRTARDFYVDRLGFEVTADLGRALFVSAGRYHHHMAMNVWNSAGAGRRQPTLGLGLVRIGVATDDEVGALAERLSRHGVPTAHDGRTLSFDDPWANRIEVSATPS
jgi:catechol 2,3-dioxygenase